MTRIVHTLLVNDMPVQVHVLDGGKVELIAEHKTVQVSGATYWEMRYDDVVPTALLVGVILAKYDELIGRLTRLADAGKEESGGAERKRADPPADL
jgi:hypothetical protein